MDHNDPLGWNFFYDLESKYCTCYANSPNPNPIFLDKMRTIEEKARSLEVDLDCLMAEVCPDNSSFGVEQPRVRAVIAESAPFILCAYLAGRKAGRLNMARGTEREGEWEGEGEKVKEKYD
jgi:hypothetical protein